MKLSLTSKTVLSGAVRIAPALLSVTRLRFYPLPIKSTTAFTGPRFAMANHSRFQCADTPQALPTCCKSCAASGSCRFLGDWRYRRKLSKGFDCMLHQPKEIYQ